MNADIDRPPAGTECCVCRNSGHFCQAGHYLGKTQKGICTPCKSGEDCAVHATLRAAEKADEGFGIMHVPKATPERKERDKTMAKTESLKWLEQTFPGSLHFLSTQSSFAITNLKYAAGQASATSWFIEEKIGDHWHIVLDHPVFYANRDEARDLARKLSFSSDGKETRTMKWSKGLAPMIAPPNDPTPAPAPVLPLRPAKGLFMHKSKKFAERQMAETMLKAGASMSQVKKETGLSLTSIQKERHKLGLVKSRDSREPLHDDASPVGVRAGNSDAATFHVEHSNPYAECAVEIDRSIADLKDRLAKLQKARDCLAELAPS